MQPAAYLPSRDSRRRSRDGSQTSTGTGDDDAASPTRHVPRHVLIESSAPGELASLLAGVQAAGPLPPDAPNPGAAAQEPLQARCCAVLHADGPMPEREAAAAALRTLPRPPPAAWAAALLRDWPPSVRGLHRIELDPGRTWLLVANQLSPRSSRRLRRELAAWRDAPTAAATAPREAIVVGAGLAGCATADAFARRGWRVTVLESADRPGGVVADVPLLAQHPALSPGPDRRARLLIAALLAFSRLDARMGSAMATGGRFQAMPIAEAWQRAAGMPADIVQVVERSSATTHGIDAHCGLWFPGCAVVDPARWWQEVATRPQITLRLGIQVAAIRRDAGQWCALDPDAGVIARAPVLVLANQAQAFGLAGLESEASGTLRRRPLQVLVGRPATAAAVAAAAAPVLGIDGYRLEWPGRACVIGPVPEGSDAAAGQALLTAWRERLAEAADAWSWQLAPPAERLLLRDNLPMAGVAPDMAAIEAARERHERNDRLELPRREGLYLLTGLGGRGLLWSVLGAEVIAARAADEPPVIEPELADAIDPARFVRRTLRRAQQRRDRTVPAQ